MGYLHSLDVYKRTKCSVAKAHDLIIVERSESKVIHELLKGILQTTHVYLIKKYIGAS